MEAYLRTCIVLYLVMLAFGTGLGHVYDITPSPMDPCPTEAPCLTLTQVANSSNFSYKNIEAKATLMLLSGYHRLEKELVIENISALFILSNSMSTVITCYNHTNLRFVNVDVVHISNLSFVGCAGNVLNSVNNFILEDSSFNGQDEFSGTALELSETVANLTRISFIFNSAVKLYSVTCYYAQQEDVKATAGGAIVSVNSSIVITESLFVGNRAEVGGAIFSVLYSSISIVNSSFEGNSAGMADSITSCTNAGGVLHAASGSGISIHGGYFVNNRAQNGGGVLSSMDISHMAIIQSEFINNSAYGYEGCGGVLYMHNSSILTISHSRFVNNHALDGGVVYTSDTDVVISDSEFVNDSSESQETYFTCNGGVLLINALLTTSDSNIISLIITRSQFVDNSALTDGGVVYASGEVNVTIESCKFINNNAQRGGIVHMYVPAVDINITIIHSMFISNTAVCIGGVVSIGDADWEPSGGTADITLAHSTFISNTAIDKGSVLSTDRTANVTITYCELSFNTGGSNGGAIAINSGGNAIITHSIFVYNSADVGGAVLLDIIEDDSTIFISHSRFINNTALNGFGGVLYGDFVRSVTMVECQFIDNSARVGGAFYVTYSADIIISHTNFTNNRAVYDGGVLWATSEFDRQVQLNVNIKGCRFSGNRADNNGGAIKISGGRLSIVNSSWDHNMAGVDGGVLHTFQTDVMMNEVLFSSNRADVSGGIMYLNGATTIVNSSIFVYNSCGHNGGVGIAQEEHMTIFGSRFDWNSAGHDGGVFILNEGTIALYGGNYSRNSAGNDGGVLRVFQGTLTASDNRFNYNRVRNDGGVIHAYQCITNISHSYFDSNAAVNDGGAINAYQGSLDISVDSSFAYSRADNNGGAVFAYQVHAIVTGNTYDGNTAGNRGGVFYIYQGIQTLVTQSIVSHSQASEGGVIYGDQGNIMVESISCIDNKGSKGGVFHVGMSAIVAKHSDFSQNSASGNGGVFFVEESGVKIEGISSKSNTAHTGGSIYSKSSRIQTFDSLLISNSSANIAVVYLLGSTATFNGNLELSLCNSSFLVFSSNVTFKGHADFINCSERIIGEKPEMMEGGALTVFKSTVNFNGKATLALNSARNGGAIQATESKIYVRGRVILMNNTATETGGGIRLDMSELHYQLSSTLYVLGNAAKKGGGIYAISSIIDVDTRSEFTLDSGSAKAFLFIENEAEKGGGLYLGMNAKVYILGSISYIEQRYIVKFSANSADYGGAIFVSDESHLDFCTSNYGLHFEAGECFIQMLAMHSSRMLSNPGQNITSSFKSIYFSHNIAQVSGSSLFGGMIDRCKVFHFTEHLLSSNYQPYNPAKIVNGISYLKNISNIDMSEIGSRPVQLCFCINEEPDCHYQPNPVSVTKGKKFSIKLIALDQVSHPINATIHSSLFKTGGGLLKDQGVQNITKACTRLTFNVFSPYDKEELILYAEGPCMPSPWSQRRLDIQFTACDSCPIGFEKHVDETTVCDCICDSRLKPYITNCNASTELLTREGTFWITYITTGDNDTSGYLIYPHCPLNYCLPPTSRVEINLNIPNGDDMQCADGRSGTLCGSCNSNLSLSLGSSRCIPCSNKWLLGLLGTLTAAILTGIGLVALLLVLNLTVAVGTLNGIIFYANIIAANKSSFLPFSAPNVITVFISWLNLEIGFDVCFSPGMDAYWKTLLQLAFPTYVIFLVIMVIVVSERSTKFACLLSKKNPVATLATLILLSYTKFLNSVIASLSFAILDYPDGSHYFGWLPDATVPYLKGKHVILFTAAVVIILAGTVYTTLLFTWQWLPKYQDRKLFRWTKYQKLCHFIEPYHAPYTFEQRYWIGLLLLVRVILYIISAVNLTGDPRVGLVSTAIIIACLLALKGILERKIYKERSIDIVELFIYINIVSFTVLTLYTFDGSKNQVVIAYMSVTFTLALFSGVIVFHIIRYTSLLSKLKKIRIKHLTRKVNHQKSYHEHAQMGSCIVTTDEFTHPLITQTIVELPKLNTEMELESVVKDEENYECTKVEATAF